MDLANWIVALSLWLLSAPLPLAFIDLSRQRSGRDGSSASTR